MNAEELPEDLARLEQALAQRPLPAPPAALQLRALGAVRSARARESNLLLAAAAAVVLAVLGLGLSLPPAKEPARRKGVELARREVRVLEGLGWQGTDALRLVFVLREAELPRFAPPMGSAVGSIAASGRP